MTALPSPSRSLAGEETRLPGLRALTVAKTNYSRQPFYILCAFRNRLPCIMGTRSLSNHRGLSFLKARDLRPHSGCGPGPWVALLSKGPRGQGGLSQLVLGLRLGHRIGHRKDGHTTLALRSLGPCMEVDKTERS